MIKSFRHKGLECFYETGSKAGIQPAHAPRLRRQLAVLDNLTTLADLPAAWKPHPLSGNLAGLHAVSVSGNWRITFEFDGSDVHLVDYRDYH